MTLDDRGRQAADDARAAAATTDLAALRARVGAEGYRDPGRGRRAGAALAVAAALLLVGLGIGLLVSGLRTTGRNSASSASRVPLALEAGGSVDAHTTGGTVHAQSGAAGSTRSKGPQLDLGNGLVADATTSLVDGQEVRLVGAGFAPGTVVEVMQCVAHPQQDSPTGVAACAEPILKVRSPASGGPVVVRFRVQRMFSTPSTRTVDCGAAPGACVIVMYGSSSASSTASASPAESAAPAEGSVAITFSASDVVTTTTAP